MISIVTPVYNEADSLRQLHKEISEVMEDNFDEWEEIYVDDGSDDGSYEVLKDLNEEDERVRVLKFSRNFGQSAALYAGFDHARGDVVVSMDSDLQNVPEDIPQLVEKLREGYDCVSGWRKERNDPITKRFPSWVQTILAKKTGPDIHDFGCTLKAYRKEAIKDIGIYGEEHRYIPAKLHKEGYEVTELPVQHRERTKGETKYGISRLPKGVLDLIFNVFWNRFSTRPLHFLGGFGLLFSVLGVFVGLYRIFMYLAYEVKLSTNLPSLILAVGLVLFGFLLIIFGFLAEMITKIYHERKKPYRIEESLE